MGGMRRVSSRIEQASVTPLRWIRKKWDFPKELNFFKHRDIHSSARNFTFGFKFEFFLVHLITYGTSGKFDLVPISLFLAWDISGYSYQEFLLVARVGFPKLLRIILKVGHYEFRFSHISGVLDKWGYSNRNRIISWDVKIYFQRNIQTLA